MNYLKLKLMLLITLLTLIPLGCKSYYVGNRSLYQLNVFNKNGESLGATSPLGGVLPSKSDFPVVAVISGYQYSDCGVQKGGGGVSSFCTLMNVPGCYDVWQNFQFNLYNTPFQCGLLERPRLPHHTPRKQ